MRIHADFSRRVTVTPDQHQWVNSPQAGVERMMLDRIGGEVARATSLVRYAPGSNFPVHRHPGGEEILVLSGTFSEGSAHFPAGWYMRNPPGSAHQPASEAGALLFVKLCQMPPTESQPVRVNTRDPAAWQRAGGRELCPLFAAGAEQVCLLRLAPGELVLSEPVPSAEVLVLAGSLVEGTQALPQGSWLRMPAGHSPDLHAGAQGVTVYLKTGHLHEAGPGPAA